MLMYLTAFLSTALAALIVYDWSVKRSRVWRVMTQHFPGEPTLPLVGNMHQLGTAPEDIQRNLFRMWEKHDRKNFRVMLGMDPMLFVCELETVKTILSSSQMIEKSDQHRRFLVEHYADSVLNASGDEWRKMRKTLTPMFHNKLLEQHLEVAIDEGNRLLERLGRHVGQPACEVRELLEEYTINVICRSAMGVNTKNKSKMFLDYVKATQGSMRIVMKRLYSAWYQFDILYKHSALGKYGAKIRRHMENTIDYLIAERQKEFDSRIKPLVSTAESVEEFIAENRTSLTMMDVLLLSKQSDGSPIPLWRIREEVNVMVFAGSDTTLITMCFVLSMLAKHRDLQQKCYQEQLDILGEDLTKDATYQDLSKMKYLQCFIKETLRLYTTIPNFARYIKEDVKLPDGRVLAAGTNVMFYVPGLHKNSEHFDDPMRFDPDRFLQPVSVYAFLPFSAGPRNCLGMNFAWMSMRSALSKILRHYALSLESPDHEPVDVNEIMLNSKNGHRVQIAPRK